MRTIGLIPARGGSKRLPGKNLRYLAGKPLIHYTIEAALLSALDAVYVSTEDKDITAVCSAYPGLHVIDRPVALADDLTPTSDVIAHALDVVACDRLVLLQPTSPLRTQHHINAALALGPCVSVKEDGSFYVRNGAIYHMLASAPMRFKYAYIMDADSSVDIDTIEDFEQAEKLIKGA